MSPASFERYVKNLERTGTSKSNINLLRKKQTAKTPSPNKCPECTKSAKCPKCKPPAFNLMAMLKTTKDAQKKVLELEKEQSKMMKHLEKVETKQHKGKLQREKKAAKKTLAVGKNTSPYIYSPKSGNRSPPKLKKAVKMESRTPEIKTPSPGPKLRPGRLRPKRIASKK